MGKMKQLQQAEEQNSKPAIFATNDQWQVLLLETVLNQKSMGWMSKENDNNKYVVFEHNLVVSKHLEIWEEILRLNLTGVKVLHTYLYNLLNDTSLQNFNLVFSGYKAHLKDKSEAR